MTKLAIFDLDHTLLTINSSYHFGLHLYRTRQLSFTTLLNVILSYIRQRLFHTPLLTMHQQHFDTLFHQKPRLYFDKQAAPFVDDFLSTKLYQPALIRLRQCKAAGYHVVIMSGSPAFLVEPIMRYLGADQMVATRYAIDSEGHFSHIESVLDGHDKARAAVQIAAEVGCRLADAEAYSDSHLDLPLLKIVGKPVGVNPNRKLRRVCIDNGWEVL